MTIKEHKEFDNESGFTLVELLVVILIIGILAAIAIPAFMNQRQRANDAAVKSDIKMIANEIETMLVSQPNAFSISDGYIGDDGNFEWTEDISESLWLRAIDRDQYGATITRQEISDEIHLSDGVHIDVVGHHRSSTNLNSPLGSHNYIVYGWHENGNEHTNKESALIYASNEGGFVDELAGGVDE